MEIVMDIIMGIVGLFIEGTAEASASKKVPRGLRTFILTLLFSGMIFFYYVAYDTRTEPDKSAMWIFLILGTTLAFLLIKGLRQYMKLADTEEIAG